MHTVGGNFSFFATPLVAGGLVAATLTWRTPYLAFAVAPLAAGVFLAAVAPRSPEREPEMAERAGMFRELGRVFRVVGPLLRCLRKSPHEAGRKIACRRRLAD